MSTTGPRFRRQQQLEQAELTGLLGTLQGTGGAPLARGGWGTPNTGAGGDGDAGGGGGGGGDGGGGGGGARPVQDDDDDDDDDGDDDDGADGGAHDTFVLTTDARRAARIPGGYRFCITVAAADAACVQREMRENAASICKLYREEVKREAANKQCILEDARQDMELSIAESARADRARVIADARLSMELYGDKVDSLGRQLDDPDFSVTAMDEK